MEKTDRTYIAWGLDDGAHEARGLKPMLTPEEQVELLKAKGVTFERCDEQKAIEALTRRDTFLHIASYRKLFQVHQKGANKGKYVRLDFADLLDLNSLDDELRCSFLSTACDIERMAKTALVARIAGSDEDGYRIVADFMESQQRRYRKMIVGNLKTRVESDVYAGELIAKYGEAMPVWVLLEVSPLGTLLAFYLFCAERWDDEPMRQEHYALKGVKAVRNCCAHGSCIINGLKDEARTSPGISSIVYDWLDETGVPKGKGRRSKLRNGRIQQLTETLAMFDRMGCRPTSEESIVRLSGLRERLDDACGRYGDQNAFVSYLGFLSRLIDKAV